MCTVSRFIKKKTKKKDLYITKYTIKAYSINIYSNGCIYQLLFLAVLNDRFSLSC